MKKRFRLLFFCILCMAVVSGCGSSRGSKSGTIKALMTVSSLDDYRTLLTDAAKEEANKQGVQIDMEVADETLENQIAHIEKAVKENYDVILCNPVDTDTALQLEEVANGIPIVFINSCPADNRLKSDKYVYVGSNDEDVGKYQADYILNHSSGKNEINVVILQGALSHSATVGRTKAIVKELKAADKKVNIVFKDTADWDRTKAADLFKLFLTTNQPYDFVASNNDTMALGVTDVMTEQNITGVPVLGVDATADGCQAISDGKMEFTVYQSAKGQGEYAIKAAIALANGKSIKDIKYATGDSKYIYVPFETVTADNVDDYK